VESGIKRIGILPESPEKHLLISMGSHFITRSY
jgi:hypothetical protein